MFVVTLGVNRFSTAREFWIFLADPRGRGAPETPPRTQQNRGDQVSAEEARKNRQSRQRIRNVGNPKRRSEIANARTPKPKTHPNGNVDVTSATLSTKHHGGNARQPVQQQVASDRLHRQQQSFL